MAADSKIGLPAHNCCWILIFRNEALYWSSKKSEHENCGKLLCSDIQGGPKNWYTLFCTPLTSSYIDRFSKLFHCQNHENMCNNTGIKDPITSQVCRYTTLWNVSVLIATIENKTVSLTKHFKSMRPPAARRTLWTFDVKTAWCDSYFREQLRQ